MTPRQLPKRQPKGNQQMNVTAIKIRGVTGRNKAATRGEATFSDGKTGD